MSAPTGGPGGQLPPGVNPKIIFADLPKIPALATSHGTIMGLVFVVILPLGSFLIRASNSKKSVWAHVAFQLVGWILMFGGLATGIKMAKILDRVGDCFFLLSPSRGSSYWTPPKDPRLTMCLL